MVNDHFLHQFPYSAVHPRNEPLRELVNFSSDLLDVVISHNRSDHLGVLTLKALAQRNPQTIFFVPLGNGEYIVSKQAASAKVLGGLRETPESKAQRPSTGATGTGTKSARKLDYLDAIQHLVSGFILIKSHGVRETAPCQRHR